MVGSQVMQGITLSRGGWRLQAERRRKINCVFSRHNEIDMICANQFDKEINFYEIKRNRKMRGGADGRYCEETVKRLLLGLVRTKNFL